MEAMSTNQAKIPFRTHAILLSVIMLFIAAALCYTFEASIAFWAIPAVFAVMLLVLVAQWYSAHQARHSKSTR